MWYLLQAAVQTLMTGLVEAALDGLGGPISALKLKEDLFNTYCKDILQNFIKGQQAELEALFALQTLMHT